MTTLYTPSPVAAITATLRQKSATQAEIIDITGFSRVTVRDRLDELETVGLVCPVPRAVETGGRPARRYKLNPSFGRILVADIGTSVVRTGIASIDGALLATASAEIPAFQNPNDAYHQLINDFSRYKAMGDSPILMTSLGLPLPISPVTGMLQVPPRQNQWKGINFQHDLSEFTGAPTILHHDVDLHALAQMRTIQSGTGLLLFIKVGMGIGCSVINNNEPITGETGYAFEIGHMAGPFIHSRGAERIPCPRGHNNCLEGVAGGRSIASALSFEGITVWSSTEIMNLAVAGNTVVRDELYTSGQVIGEAIAPLVNMLNPGIIAVGGSLTTYSDLVYQGLRNTALTGVSTMVGEAITFMPAQLGDNGGLVGATLTAIDRIFSDDSLKRILSENRGAY